MNRYVVIGAAAVAAVSAGGITTAPSAQAANLAPSGCKPYAFFVDWRQTCYVGVGYIESGGLVTGISDILYTWDGWGSDMNSNYGLIYSTFVSGAVADLQSSHGLYPDRIVGPQTWAVLGSYVWNCNVSDPNFLYYESNFNGNGTQQCGLAGEHKLRVQYKADANQWHWQAFRATTTMKGDKWVWMAA